MVLRLNSIALIENFIVRTLLSNKDIPVDVNILRLADTDDREGAIIFPKYVTVRFTGSNTQTLSTQPLILARSMDFELEIGCQNQQGSHGHDYATYLLGACALALLNKVPFETGITIATPFTLERETFAGISDSGHFIYNQSWSIVTEDVFPSLSSDPTIAKGFCDDVWKKGIGERSVLLGEVVSGNGIYQLKPTEPLDCEKYGGVIPSESGDLVTVEDNNEVYLTNAQIAAGFQYVVKELDDSDDILVTVRASSGELIRSDLFCATGKTFLGLYVFGSNRGLPPEKITTVTLPASKQAVVINNLASLFKDPSDTEEIPLPLKYGNLIFVDEEITLNVGEKSFVRAYSPSAGLYWLPDEPNFYRVISEQFVCHEEE